MNEKGLNGFYHIKLIESVQGPIRPEQTGLSVKFTIFDQIVPMFDPDNPRQPSSGWLINSKMDEKSPHRFWLSNIVDR